MTFTADELPLCSESLPPFLFNKLAIFYIHRPNALRDLVFGFTDVFTSSILFVIAIVSFIGISIGVSQITQTFNLVVLELSSVLLSSTAHCQLSLSILFPIFEMPNVYVSIAIIEFTFSVELIILKLSVVNLTFKGVNTPAILFIIPKVTIVDCSVRLSKFTLALLPTLFELSLVVSVLFNVFEFSIPIELVILELSLILHHSSQHIFSSSLLQSISKTTLIVDSADGFVSTILELVFRKLPFKFVAIRKGKLTVLTMFKPMFHVSRKNRTVRIVHIAVDELSVAELSCECTVFLCPDTFTVGTTLIEKAFVFISVFVRECAIRRQCLLKLSLED